MIALRRRLGTAIAHSSLLQLSIARVREFGREPEAVFWVFLFPILMALALAVAFRSQPAAPVPIAVEAGPRAEEVRAGLLEATGNAGVAQLRPEILPLEEARAALRRGRVDLVLLATDPPTYWLDPTRPDSRRARLEVDAALAWAARGDRRAPPATTIREMREPGSRYVDFLLPGLLGMNLMGTGMWSIGFSIVQQRVGRLLKRLVAAPIPRWQILAAQVLARFFFLGAEVAALVAFGYFALDVPLRGSLLAFGTVSVVGGMAFVGLGLLIAARPKTVEGVSGLMNFVMLPMWIGSGTFFSRERFPEAAQPFLQALPLTALNDALRAVQLDGASLAAVAPELGVLAAWAVVCFLVALRIFRWD